MKHAPLFCYLGLLAWFAGLVLVYSFATPLFEAPDEVWHYAYVRWLAEGHGLPSMANNDSGANQEVAQPPLYYAAAAVFSAPFADADLEALFWGNPQFGYQAPGYIPDNKNMLIHTAREAWPWRGAVLAIRAARLTSLLFGLLTLFAAWGLGREASGSTQGAWLTAALVAFTPQFCFISAVVSNDSAAAATATLALWALARALRRGFTPRRSLIAGALIGLATLAKVSNLALGGLALLAMAGVALTQRRPWLRNAALLVAAALAVGGWWYVRNGLLYGDPLALHGHTTTPWTRTEPATLLQLLADLPTVYRSFWAAFGWGHIEFAPWVYWLLLLAPLCALIGWIRALSTRPSASLLPTSYFLLPSPYSLCTLWLLLVFAALLQWMRMVGAPHGRLLFPAIGAWAVLLSGGWRALPAARRWLPVPLAGLALLSLMAPWYVIRPALAAPPLLDPTRAAATVDGPAWAFDGGAQLLGVRLDRDTVAPGERLEVRACWQASAPIAHDYTVYVQLVGRNATRGGERLTYPGLGRFPTSLWPVGRAFCDTYSLPVEPWIPVPELYDLWLGLYDYDSGERLGIRAADGNAIGLPIVAQVRVAQRVAAAPTPVVAADYRLGDGIALLGYSAPATLRAGQPYTVTLHWRALTPLPADYHVFVHLQDAQGQPLAQHDGAPRYGRYPTTAWRSGDGVADEHPLMLPADCAGQPLRLVVGMYDPTTLARLPVAGVPDGAILLTELEASP